MGSLNEYGNEIMVVEDLRAVLRRTTFGETIHREKGATLTSTYIYHPIDGSAISGNIRPCHP
jgi:hypothetical protein